MTDDIIAGTVEKWGIRGMSGRFKAILRDWDFGME